MPWWGYPGGPGWDQWYWDYPGSELVVIEDPEKEAERKRLLAYIATLPAAQRAAAFEKLFGKKATAGLDGITDTLTSPTVLALAAVGAALFFALRRRS